MFIDGSEAVDPVDDTTEAMDTDTGSATHGHFYTFFANHNNVICSCYSIFLSILVFRPH